MKTIGIIILLTVIAGLFIFDQKSDEVNESQSVVEKVERKSYTASDLLKNASAVEEGTAYRYIRLLLEKDMRRFHDLATERRIKTKGMTDLEWEVFLESEKGKKFKELFKKVYNKYTTSPQFMVLKEGFRKFRIRDYNLDKKTFSIDLEYKTNKENYKPNIHDSKMVWEIIFKTMPIYFSSPYVTLDISVPKDKAIKIERNRSEIDCKIYFFLDEALQTTAYVRLEGKRIPLKYPVAKAAMLRLTLGDEILFEKLYAE